MSFRVRGVAYEVAPGRDVTVPLQGQGPIVKGTPQLSPQARHRREDGTVMVPSVPTKTEPINLVPSLEPTDMELQDAVRGSGNGRGRGNGADPDSSMGELDAAEPRADDVLQ
ncbi:hypothetical protein [Naasia aerilata]|uniref:Uncharacterized protein n=1 Tax=Naasia aerilata TaxID=1162966 RepID=A0ABM8GFK2_9MICO|nr:hypothetical protein GCM10025866_30500 [Naasia aerilata]